MTASLALVLASGILIATGVYLTLERSLSRIVIGLALLSNGVNLLFLIAGGRAGRAPINTPGASGEMADPLPQAMVLTAIVISLGLTAFVLAMAYRSWQLHGHDEVQDDLEDRRLAARLLDEDVDADESEDADLETEAAEARDETEEFEAHGGSGVSGPAGRAPGPSDPAPRPGGGQKS